MPHRWTVELIGERFDLVRISQIFTTARCMVVVREDRAFLSSNRFDPRTNGGDILDAAAVLVHEINGAMLVQLSDHVPVKLGAAFDGDPLGKSDVSIRIAESSRSTARLFPPALGRGRANHHLQPLPSETRRIQMSMPPKCCACCLTRRQTRSRCTSS